jgi:hypothetical protein
MSDTKVRTKERVPAKQQERYASLVSLTDAVCRQHLNEEYAELCRKMAAALCRKRPSPVDNGQPASWACGIVQAIGSVNFLFDKTQAPHWTAHELCAFFGISQSNAALRARQLRTLFHLSPMNWEWTLPSRMAKNPLVWMIQVNGVILDVRMAPREVQELAFAKGLIPYLPTATTTGTTAAAAHSRGPAKEGRHV